MVILRDRRQIGRQQQRHKQIDKRQHPDHARHFAQLMNDAIAQHGNHNNDRAEQQHTGHVRDRQQPCHRLTGQHGTAGRKADIHHAHQYQRHHGAKHAKLRPADDHLRQPQARPLQRMQRHHRRAEHLPHQQPNQRPDNIASQHHRQRTGDDGGNLQITAKPQRKLAKGMSMAFMIGNIIDRPRFRYPLLAMG